MPAASLHSTRPRARAAAGASAYAAAWTRGARAAAGVRWDRVARMAMLCVLVALAYLYLSAGVRMFSTWRQDRSDEAKVAALESEHRALLRRHGQLTQPGTLEAQARALGMMRPGEQPYVLTGLPDN
jgi:hypothetical protein